MLTRWIIALGCAGTLAACAADVVYVGDGQLYQVALTQATPPVRVAESDCRGLYS